MGDTWWGQVIDLLGAELLVNNSWSGSRVSKLPDSQSLFPSGCSDERTNGLHIRDVNPDVIIVYLGTNDWGCGVPPEPKRIGFFDKHKKNHVDGFTAPNETVFSFAYDVMIKKLRKNYPNAEICCCTLNKTYMSENPGFVFPAAHGGTHIDVYNNIIRSAANRFKCTPTKPPVVPLPIAPIQLDTVIAGKYKLEKILAVGPHAVYLASVEGESKKVAIKVEDISRFNTAVAIASIKEAFELHKAIKHPEVPAMIRCEDVRLWNCYEILW